MSVVSGKRRLSKIEVQYNAYKLYDSIILLCLRSFGIYSRNSPIRSKYSNAIKLYDEADYYDKIITKSQDRLESLSSKLVDLVTAANAIYPRIRTEAELRLDYQNKALGTSYMIQSELNRIADIFKVDINCFKDSVELLDYEIHLIKEWRKSDRKVFKRYFL